MRKHTLMICCTCGCSVKAPVASLQEAVAFCETNRLRSGVEIRLGKAIVAGWEAGVLFDESGQTLTPEMLRQ